MLKSISSKSVKRNITAAFISLHPFTEGSNFAFCATKSHSYEITEEIPITYTKNRY